MNRAQFNSVQIMEKQPDLQVKSAPELKREKSSTLVSITITHLTIDTLGTVLALLLLCGSIEPTSVIISIFAVLDNVVIEKC